MSDPERTEMVSRIGDLENDLQGAINAARSSLPRWLFKRNEGDLRDALRLLNVIYESFLTDEPLEGEESS